MKRPLCTFALGFVPATYLCVVLGYEHLNVLLLVAAGCLVGAFVLPTQIKKYIAAATVGIVAACGVFWFYTAYTVAPFEALSGQTATFTGTITELEQRGGYYLFETYGTFNTIDTAPKSFFLPAIAKGTTDLQVGDSITGDFTVFKPDNQLEKQRMLSRGVYLSAIALGAQRVQSRYENSLPVKSLELRRTLSEIIYDTIPGENATLMAGLLLSETALIPNKLAQGIRASGVSHLLVVSGFHVSILISFLTMMLSKMRLKQWLISIIGSLGCLLIMWIMGFTPSIVRSGIMMIMVLMAHFVQRTPDRLTSLSFAAIVLLCTNPYMIVSYSFILSFVAVLSITLFADPLRNYMQGAILANRHSISKVESTLLDVFSMSVGVLVLVYPVLSILFGTIPTYGVLVSVLLTPLISVIIVMGASMILLHFMGLWWLSGVFAYGAGFLCEIAKDIILFAASLPFNTIFITQVYQIAWLVILCAMATLLVIIKAKKRFWHMAGLALALPLIIAAAQHHFITQNAVKVVTGEYGQVALVQNRSAVALEASSIVPLGSTYALVQGMGVDKVELLVDDSVDFRMDRAVLSIQNLQCDYAAVDQFILPKMSLYLPAKTQVFDRDATSFTVLNGVKISASDNGFTVIEIGNVKILKLSYGYGTIEEIPFDGYFDLIIAPDGEFTAINPSLKPQKDLWGRRYILLAAGGAS